MKKLTLLVLLISTFALQGIAQKVTNVVSKQDGNKIIVSYKVEGGPTDRCYSPTLYYSTDGGSNYNKCKSTNAKYAKLNQTAKITWNVTNDLDYFGSSDIVFKVTVFHKLLIDGKYKTIIIGNQVWLAENLKLDVGNGCWCFGNKQANCNKYGRLYTWEAAKRAANKIAGWHLPTDAEWKQMERYLGMSKSSADDTGWRGRGNIGDKLKSTYGWNNNGNGTNSSGFSALPGGYRSSDGDFYTMGYYALFWAATAYNSSSAWSRTLHCSDSGVSRYDIDKDLGYSVRLVRD